MVDAVTPARCAVTAAQVRMAVINGAGACWTGLQTSDTD